MTTIRTLTLPVTEMDHAVSYYEQVLGVEARWRGATHAVLQVGPTEIRLVRASREEVTAAIEDGTLDEVIDTVWRMTGGWTVTPGRGAVCCPQCAALADDSHATEPVAERKTRWARRARSGTAPDDRRQWDALRGSGSIAGSALSVLQSAVVRRLRISRAAHTEYGVRLSFTGGDLPDVVLVGALQSPPAGSVLQTPFAARETVGIPFRAWGRRKRMIVTCDRVQLA
jgi:hypothetical protein